MLLFISLFLLGCKASQLHLKDDSDEQLVMKCSYEFLLKLPEAILITIFDEFKPEDIPLARNSCLF